MIVPCILLLAFQFVFLTRLVISFFPISDNSFAGRYRDLSVSLTDPLVVPVRKMVPPVSGALRGFGFAEIIVLLVLFLLTSIVCGVAGVR